MVEENIVLISQMLQMQHKISITVEEVHVSMSRGIKNRMRGCGLILATKQHIKSLFLIDCGWIWMLV